MNAITYIQQHGIEKAREILKVKFDAETFCLTDNSYWSESEGVCDACVILSELQRLVQSIDLVKYLGGYERTKARLKMARKNGSDSGPDYLRRKQAIADYEAIYEQTH